MTCLFFCKNVTIGFNSKFAYSMRSRILHNRVQYLGIGLDFPLYYAAVLPDGAVVDSNFFQRFVPGSNQILSWDTT